MKDLNLLFTFEALWRDHSVSIAAENLGVTQGAVSSSLKRLRQEYGDKLFAMVGRRMEPTPFAVQIAPTLLDALDLVREAQTRALEFAPQHCRKVFTLRTRDIGEAVCLPTILKLLQAEAPLCRITTVASPVEETLSGLSIGRIDLAIGYLPTLKTDIHRTVVSSQQYVCALRTGHPLADVELTLERFLRQQHLLVETGGTGHVLLERALIEAGARNNIGLRIPQYLSAPYLLLESDMLWVVPAVLGKTLSRHFPLLLKPVPLVLPEFDIALYWHDRFHRDPQNKWFREMVATALRQSLQD
ncbi:LysR family transcriptional regulator [Pseudomonas sp. SZMC_28357]|uniref:LysR family transcriptional regulator n=1 Tax=Pseudomonas sp. SZMC_28357 TaxID=3074380 RepID=UPI00287221ED|nr:LysR family transcriptional regulator [Pseudomonas sp. SZMC_28357]MDR9752494.1 LysR family transcriptional regulator [Pseudomonas sp. SZMC_28357]